MSSFNPLRWSRPSWIWRYGISVLLLASAMILSRWLSPHMGFPGTVYLCVVMLSGWFGGVGPSLLATTLSGLAFHYSFLHPVSSFGPAPREMPRLLMYVISNLIIGLLGAAQRNSTESLRRANDALLAESRERKQTEEALRQAQADLTHANRVSSMGELTASLAHEVNQPIAATITNANTCLLWLSRDQPDLEEARAAASRIVQDGRRAGEIVNRVRQLFMKDTLRWELVNPNETIREMMLLIQGEATRFAIFPRAELAADLPYVMADRVQLQQVLMNLMMNSIEAMRDVPGTRELTIRSKCDESGQAVISVCDTGTGLPPQQADQIFNAFFTTKTHGTGMGLRISRSIVESHGGRLWASDNSPRGATFQFTLPTTKSGAPKEAAP